MTTISSLSALTGAGVDAAADLITVADMSETGIARSKKMTFAELKVAVGAYTPGGTDVALADGGTGASTADAARTNLGAAPAFLTVSTETGTSYTADIDDANTYIRFTNGSAVAFTIPPNSSVAFATGTRIRCIAAGAGTVTLTPGSGVTLNSRGGDLASAGQFAVMEVIKVATDTWDVAGDVA